MSSGTVMGVSPRRAHFSIGSGNGFYLYWHARLVNRLGPGSRVTRGEFVADVQAGRHHVHVAESESGCGLVDPRRPTGVLRDPENQERPRIGPISAYIADRHAFAPVDTEVNPAQLSDPATPLSLDDLHGAVDFRASLTDIPVHKMRHQPQIPLEVAAIRGYPRPRRTAAASSEPCDESTTAPASSGPPPGSGTCGRSGRFDRTFATRPRTGHAPRTTSGTSVAHTDGTSTAFPTATISTASRRSPSTASSRIGAHRSPSGTTDVRGAPPHIDTALAICACSARPVRYEALISSTVRTFERNCRPP